MQTKTYRQSLDEYKSFLEQISQAKQTLGLPEADKEAIGLKIEGLYNSKPNQSNPQLPNAPPSQAFINFGLQAAARELEELNEQLLQQQAAMGIPVAPPSPTQPLTVTASTPSNAPNIYDIVMEHNQKNKDNPWEYGEGHSKLSGSINDATGQELFKYKQVGDNFTCEANMGDIEKSVAAMAEVMEKKCPGQELFVNGKPEEKLAILNELTKPGFLTDHPNLKLDMKNFDESRYPGISEQQKQQLETARDNYLQERPEQKPSAPTPGG